MKHTDKTPVRPAAVHFDAPTHEPLVAAILITQVPDTGEYHAFVRTGEKYTAVDRHIVGMLVQSCEIRNAPETPERTYP